MIWSPDPFTTSDLQKKWAICRSLQKAAAPCVIFYPLALSLGSYWEHCWELENIVGGTQ
jgi:hypothetical protein